MNALNIYNSTSNKAEFNLALEEYLLLHSKEDILLFYFNDKSVIIGKHQNPWKEVSLAFCRDNNISLRRRLSGGGTVYHDLNNLNFSYIRNKGSDFVNFREHIEPISKALSLLGIQNTITERNDIFIADKKVSGNAEHVNNTKKRILHHGTLLLKSDLNLLRTALAPLDYDINTHAVNSVRSAVTTLSQYIDIPDSKAFLQKLITALGSIINIEETAEIHAENIEEVSGLVKEKYASWNWNFGHSPQFTYTNPSGDEFIIRKGKFLKINSSNIPAEIQEQLIGLTFDQNTLKLNKNLDIQQFANKISIY